MSSPTETASPGRWHGRPVLSALLRGAVFVVPIAISIASAVAVSRLLPAAHTLGWELGWWAAVLAVPVLVLVLTDRVARKALPLAVLLQMTLVFPDQAPKRLAVARRAGSTRDLARRVEEARNQGDVDEPTVAAEKILALAGALNAHDRLTRGHGERVRAVTDLIADELHLPSEDRDRLRWSALLHDIGKLTVHPHILNKPDKLDDHEWAVMRNHPLEGAKLTAPLAGWLGPWSNTIAEHHERYDGQGYPYGLSGQAISLGGRIVAVADSYDVMTNFRSYKRPMSAEAARAELAACAGAQFDPQVVRAFLDVSIGKLRPVAGPIAWLGSLPFVGNLPQLGTAAAAVGRAAATLAVVAGSALAGVVVDHGSSSGFGGQLAGAVHLGLGSGPGATSGGAPTGVPGRPAADAGGRKSPSGGRQRSSSHQSVVTTTTQVAGSIDAGSPSGADLGGVADDEPGATTSTTVAGVTTVPTTTTTAAPEQAQDGSLDVAAGSSTQSGRPQQGNEIIVTYSPAPDPSLLCSAWTSTSTPELDDPNVVVTGTQPSSGDDTLSVSDSGDCAGGFNFGTIDLEERGFFNSGTVTFGGSSGTCSGSTTSGCSSIQWAGGTLTITLGVVGTGQPTQKAASVAVYTPAAALGLVGTISSPDQTQF